MRRLPRLESGGMRKLVSGPPTYTNTPPTGRGKGHIRRGRESTREAAREAERERAADKNASSNRASTERESRSANARARIPKREAGPATEHPFNLDLDDELVRHLPDPVAWSVMKSERFNEVLIVDEASRDIYLWQREHI